jgi:hypothetical protein
LIVLSKTHARVAARVGTRTARTHALCYLARHFTMSSSRPALKAPDKPEPDRPFIHDVMLPPADQAARLQENFTSFSIA